MHMTTKVQGMRIAMDLYRLPNQPNFDGDLAAGNQGFYGGGKKAGRMRIRAGFHLAADMQVADNAELQILIHGVLAPLIAAGDIGIDPHTVTMLEYFKKQNVDAVLITGDVATTGLEEEYQKFNDIWDSVFTDPAAAPEKIVMTGNHEFEQAYYGRETVEDVYRKYMEAYGYDSINRNVVVGGYHFITLTSESAAVDGQYTQVTTDWLKEQLDAAVAENPYQPIFVRRINRCRTQPTAALGAQPRPRRCTTCSRIVRR